jgi:hypothetical protein
MAISFTSDVELRSGIATCFLLKNRGTTKNRETGISFPVPTVEGVHFIYARTDKPGGLPLEMGTLIPLATKKSGIMQEPMQPISPLRLMGIA